MTEHHFKKGDQVPEWVERVEPVELQYRLTFDVDALVEKYPDGLCLVYPETEIPEGDSLLRFENADILEDTKIIGAPTRMFMYPRDDERNNPKPGHSIIAPWEEMGQRFP